MHVSEYVIVVEPVATQKGQRYVATVLDLPGCIAHGATHDAAIEAVMVEIPEWIAEAKRFGRPIRAPGASLGKWNPRAQRIRLG